MGLIGNYSLLQKTPGSFISGSSAAPGYISGVRSNFDKPGSLRGSELHFGKFYAIPQGYSAPYAYLMPRVYNFISSYTSSNGLIESNVLMAGGRNLEAPMASNITSLNAQLDQIVTFIGSSLLTFSKVNAQLDASVNLQISAVASIATNANIGAIIDALASSNMAITPIVMLTALAQMNAEAGGPTPLSPEGLAEAVWKTQINTLKADELLTLLETVQRNLDEVHKIHGLDSSNPMTVTETSRVAGSVTQNFTGDGISTTTVTRV